MKLLLAKALSILTLLTLTTYSIANTDDPAKTTKDHNGEVVAWFMAVNKNEINAANEALKKSDNADVKGFANLMIEQHSANLQEITNKSHELNIQPDNTASVKQVMQAGQKEMNSLKKLNGSHFDRMYMNAMVKDHAGALKAIDSTILKKVSNDELKQYVMDTRTHVEDHLKKAQVIQAELK
jgi:putative membrane protein